MGGVERDPAGILERVPELAAIAEASPAVRRAIEKGKPIAAYRALLFFKWFRAKGIVREKASELLRHRRLFLEPLARAPALFTYNGLGVTLYGRAELDSDRTYIGTHYVVLFFVPIFPLRCYLAADGDTPRSYRFIGKVPATPLIYLWQRAVAALGVYFVAAAAFGAALNALHGDLWVANGLSKPVRVEVSGGAPFDVPAHDVASARLSRGKHTITVSSSGKILDQGEFALSSGRGPQWWNVVGSALVYVEDVVYAAKGEEDGHAGRDAEVHCEPGYGKADDVKDVFTASPSSVSMSKDTKQLVRRRVDLVRAPGACIEYFASNGKMKEAALLARRTAEVEGLPSGAVETAADLLERVGDAEGAITLVRAARDQNEGSIEHHRTYQTVYEALGKRDELAVEYRKRLQTNPGSADAIYLLARIVAPDEESALLDRGLGLAPRHPYLLRARAFLNLHRGDFRRVVGDLSTLRQADAALWGDSAEMQVEALAALSEVAAARGVVADALALHGLADTDRITLTTDAVELSTWDPPEDVSQLVGRLEPATRVLVRLDGGLPVSKSDLEVLPGTQRQRAYEVALVARDTPRAALDALEKLGPDVAGSIPGVYWALLLGEAARLDPPHAALAPLTTASSVGTRRAEQMIEYVKSGKASLEMDEMPSEIRAAIHLARARRPALPAKERTDELARVKVLDALRGPVSHARDAWKD